MEWLDTLDRLKSMVGRIVKDRARAEAAREELSPDLPGPPEPGLSTRQASINEQILARRNRLKGTQ